MPPPDKPMPIGPSTAAARIGEMSGPLPLS